MYPHERRTTGLANTMNMIPRPLALGLLFSVGLLAHAQSYDLTVAGYVSGCTPGAYVNITTVGTTEPALDIDVPLDGSCSFLTTIQVTSDSGAIQIGTMCLGAWATQTISYVVDPMMPDSSIIYAPFDCGNQTVDCLGQPGGSALPGSPCTTFLGTPGTWNNDCACIADTTGCSACFTMQQADAFTALFTSCSAGSIDSLLWDFSGPGGGAVIGDGILHTFPVPGYYAACLNVFASDGAICNLCQQVYVDTSGGVSLDSIFLDCLGMPNGSALPGTPCTVMGTTLTGTWSAQCVCVPDTANLTCDAGFWVIQAYDSTAGGVEPIPNEVWVWNLSSGGNGVYQFTWDFGDGTTSTEAFPSHAYTGPGPWMLCLTMASGDPATGSTCTDLYCDSVSVDENGILVGMAPLGGHPVPVDDRSGGFTLNVVQGIPSAVNETTGPAEIKLWPNPAEDLLNISVGSSAGAVVPVEVVAANGRVILRASHRFLAGRDHLQLPIGRLDAGLYLVRIGTGTTMATQRFLKVR